MRFEKIKITDAYENNLKHVSLEIPKDRLCVFTGVSGSGKSSLVFDTVAAQSRRELNDTFPAYTQHYLPKYGRPHVGNIENLPVAIVIDQKKPAPGQRSTVGTYTDVYTMLRLLFSRAGKPFVGYSDVFSFNHPEGSCPECAGLGEVTVLDIHKLVDFDKSLNDPGCIHYHAFEPGQWRWRRYAASGLFDLDKKIKDYTPEELDLFLNSDQIRLKNPPKEWPKTAKYEGLVKRMYRSVIHSEEGRLKADLVAELTTHGQCPKCKGRRLSEKVLSCKLAGLNISEACDLSLRDFREWLQSIDDPVAVDIKELLGRRIDAFCDIGLSYLTLSRQSSTLSGGEIQRLKIAKYMTSSLSDMVYILDEPSAGLHPDDITRLLSAVKKLRDHGNTVLLIEHNKAMIREADHVVDIGPGSGEDGGQIMYEGDYEGLLRSNTVTGRALRRTPPGTVLRRTPEQWFTLSDICYHNLKHVDVRIPLGVFCVIHGVAGSGKTSLMEVFHEHGPEGSIFLSQKGIGATPRSTPATYLGIADEIRRIFAARCGVRSSLFSFNGEGKCPVCDGKGVIVSEMAFMDSIETVCEACHGLRYSKEVLDYRVDGMNIAEVMDLTVEKAADWFRGTEVSGMLENLMDTGLSYLHLNQSVSTMSGGEQQRMKLATCLSKKGSIFILDEPACGLHLADTERIVALFRRMVSEGSSVIIIDHSPDVIWAADYTVELGPGGGDQGGRILFAGTPEEMIACPDSVTGKYMKEYMTERV